MPNTAPYDANFTVPERLHVDRLSFTGGLVTNYASTTNLTAECPLCKQLSRRIHGCYTRTLADLLWCGTPVRLRVRVRKFFCDVPSCERRVLAERLKDVARIYARGTDRQREALEWITFALGGQAGARLARQLGLHVSPDTLLNRIREAFCADDENVRVLGVDDFGLGRDNAPGTILVDLERHKIVDLLGEHSVVAVSSYVSAQIVTPAPEQATRFARADLVFYGVDDSGPSFEARVFIDNEGATAETPKVDPSYIGSFRIFGHGGCFGEDEHCDVPKGAQDAFDL